VRALVPRESNITDWRAGIDVQINSIAPIESEFTYPSNGPIRFVGRVKLAAYTFTYCLSPLQLVWSMT
jgi:hypothetical protein